MPESKTTRGQQLKPTDAELLEFVARFAGLKYVLIEKDGTVTHQLENDSRDYPVPDYLNSLDAWHRDVWPKIHDDRYEVDWWAELVELIGNVGGCDWKYANADARSRCLALWRALDGKLPDALEGGVK